MKEFISKWSNWWIFNPKRKQLDEAFEKELNELIEREVGLRRHDIVGRSEQLKAEDKDLPFADYLERWYELIRYEKVYYRKDGKGIDTEDEVIKKYRRAFRL